jgi:hypothetical protein
MTSALGRCLTAAAAAYLAVSLAMTVVTVVAAPAGDTVIAQLAELRGGDGLYRAGFFLASLVPATMVPLMAVVALGVVAPLEGEGLTGARLCGWIAALLTAAYAPLSAAAYASQYTVFDWLLRRDLAAAAPWYFNNQQAAPYTFDLLAYAIWGAGALIAAWPLLARAGLYRWLAWPLALSGSLSIAAFGLHALGADLAGVLSVAAGVLTAPFALAAALFGRRLSRGGHPAPIEEGAT